MENLTAIFLTAINSFDMIAVAGVSVIFLFGVAFTKVNDFVNHLLNGYHGDFDSANLNAALSNTAPASETSNPLSDGNGVLANVTEISYTNISSRAFTGEAISFSAGVASVTLNDLVLTASGAVPTFRYVYIYNAATTTVTNGLIGMYDYGAGGVTLANGETFTIDFTDAQTLFDVS